MYKHTTFKTGKAMFAEEKKTATKIKGESDYEQQ